MLENKKYGGVVYEKYAGKCGTLYRIEHLTQFIPIRNIFTFLKNIIIYSKSDMVLMYSLK